MSLTLASAQRDFGRIGLTNGKMPGSTFAVTTEQCQVGGKLMTVEGSVCHGCYANRLEKYRDSAHKGWTANYLKATTMIATQPENWARAMAFQITKLAEKSGEAYHRWFDAGDLQSIEMLRAICLVCEFTPTIKHWLPTREAKIVTQLLRERDLPANLVVRISSTMIDDKPTHHPNTSTVHRRKPHHGVACEARTRGNQCGPCRACWDKNIPNISYPYH